ncbi:hypothetical protein RISK_000183 [Rhodopirellula islandica]|uniref:Uncharacterized protein n=1 Tax=Rhodopirellula islandica TaxID=595434 RepID=A0A0J1BMU1_RHOIS|nr:hypothetical protein RISK_000183 [Rhodopirellula islandica]
MYAQVPVAPIIGEDEDDVRLLSGIQSYGCDAAEREQAEGKRGKPQGCFNWRWSNPVAYPA